MIFYVDRGGEVEGPFSEEQLQTLRQRGALTNNAQVCRDGEAVWIPLASVLPEPPQGSALQESAGNENGKNRMFGNLRLRTAGICGATIIIVGAAAVAWYRKPNIAAEVEHAPKATPTPTAREQDFYRNGMLLQEYCTQGVNFIRFSDQLAETKASFRIAEPDLRRGDSLRITSFQMALDEWTLTLDWWRRMINGRKFIYRYEEGLNDVLKQFGEPQLNSEDPIAVAELVRIGLRNGSDQFQRALEFVDMETEVRKVKSHMREEP